MNNYDDEDDGWIPVKASGPANCSYCHKPVERTYLLRLDGKVKVFCKRDATNHIDERRPEEEPAETFSTTNNGD